MDDCWAPIIIQIWKRTLSGWLSITKKSLNSYKTLFLMRGWGLGTRLSSRGNRKGSGEWPTASMDPQHFNLASFVSELEHDWPVTAPNFKIRSSTVYSNQSLWHYDKIFPSYYKSGRSMWHSFHHQHWGRNAAVDPWQGWVTHQTLLTGVLSLALASYPGLPTPTFVACSTNVGKAW